MCVARSLEANPNRSATELREIIWNAGERGHDAIFHELMAAGAPGLGQALQGIGLLEMLIEEAERPHMPTRTAYVLCISDAIKAGVDVHEPTTVGLWQRLEPIVRAHASLDQEWRLVKMAQLAGYPWAQQATLDYLARLSGVESGELRQASRYGLSLFNTLADLHLDDFEICWPSTADPRIL